MLNLLAVCKADKSCCLLAAHTAGCEDVDLDHSGCQLFSSASVCAGQGGEAGEQPGVYRPPRINPTSMDDGLDPDKDTGGLIYALLLWCVHPSWCMAAASGGVLHADQPQSPVDKASFHTDVLHSTRLRSASGLTCTHNATVALLACTAASPAPNPAAEQDCSTSMLLCKQH